MGILEKNGNYSTRTRPFNWNILFIISFFGIVYLTGDEISWSSFEIMNITKLTFKAFGI